MSADHVPPAAPPTLLVPAAIGTVALAAASVFLAFPTDGTRPGPWAVTALALLVAVGGGLVAGRSRIAGLLLPGSAAALVITAYPGVRALDDVVRGGPAPGPALLLAAAVAATGLAWAARPPSGSDAPAAPTGGSRTALAGGVALAVVAGSVAGVRIGLDEGAARAERPRDRSGEALVRSILDAQDGAGPARATAVVPGGLVEVTGDHVMVAADTGEGDGEAGTQVIDARTGAVVWRDPDVVRFAVGTPDGAGFLLRRNGPLVRVDAATGATVWEGPGEADDPTLVADGVAVAMDEAAVPRIEILDLDTGATVITLASPCRQPDLVGAGALVVLCSSAEDGQAMAYVVAPGTSEPAWSGTVARYGRIAAVGSGGVLLGQIGGPSIVLDATTGRQRFTVALADDVVLDAGGETLVTLAADGVVTTRDAADGRVLGTLVLEPGPEADPATIVGERGRFTVEGGLLVGSHRDGLGTAWSPAGEKRRGLVVWDLATGARVERALAGPVVASPDVLQIDTLAVVDRVVALGEAIFDGPDAGRYTTVFTIGAR